MIYNIFNTLLDAVFVIDENKQIVFVNEPAANLSGQSARRIKSRTPFSQVITTDPEFIPANIHEVSEPTAYKEVIFVGAANQMTGYIQVTIQPVPVESGPTKHWIIFARDISLEVSLQNKYQLESKAKREALAKVERSKYDPLTGIFHKGIFLEKFATLFNELKTMNKHFCLCVFDLDNFKKVNDNYGHSAGDLVLQEVVKVVKDTVRGSDFFARYGGEEFVIIFENTPLDKVEFVCERIRQAVADHQVKYLGTTLNVTLSMGIGEINPSFEKAEDFFNVVDKASYESKKAGKNKLTVAK